MNQNENSSGPAINDTDIEYSVSNDGEKFAIPQEQDYVEEFKRIEKLANQAREENKEIVVVMGMGFVGIVMAAIVADTVDSDGQPSKFVIGCQRPSIRSFWKISLMNRGQSPLKAEDPEVKEIIERTVLERKHLLPRSITTASSWLTV